MVADLEILHGRADFLDDAGELVAEDRAHARVRDEAVVEVEVGTADAGPGDAHDGVIGMFDDRFRHLFRADLVGAAIARC
jgi:hypothetical protein